MKEVSAAALQQSRRDCDQAFDNWFRSLKKPGSDIRHPRFKSKKSHDFSYREVALSDGCFDFDHRMLNVPKLKKVRFRLRRLPKNFVIKSVRSITVRKTPSGKYFASLCCEAECPEPVARRESQMPAIGLDWSPKDMFVADDGKTGRDYAYVAFKQASAKKLHMLQRRMQKKQKDSRNRNKARIKVARLEERIANRRKDFQEKLALELVRKYRAIGVEDLDLKGISRFLRNARNAADTGWGSFVMALERKAPRFNSAVVKADRWFPSSKTCSRCGHVNGALKLSDRNWTCPHCGTSHARDVNAAVNLRNYALSTLGSRGIEACGDSSLYPAPAGQAASAKQECRSARTGGNGSHLQ